MKGKLVKNIFKIMFLLTMPFYCMAEEPFLASDNLAQFKGDEIKVCGNLVQIKNFKKGTYLNLNKKYPKQPMTFVLWKDVISNIESEWGNLRTLKNQSVCATGKINSYKGKLQINVNNSYEFEVLSN